MRIRRWLRPAATVMLVGLVSVSFAACGDDDDTEDASPSATGAGEEGAEGLDVATIEMKDYAFAVEGPLVEGGSIEFSNTGEELHMAGFGKFKDGKGLDDVQEVLEQMSGGPGGEEGGEGGATETTEEAAGRFVLVAETSTTEGVESEGGEEGGEGEEDPFADILEEVSLPGSFYLPGSTARVSASNLEPGNYGIICFIPTEGGGPPHFAQGMLAEIEVVEGEATREEEVTATYEIDDEGNVTGPATLDAGEQTIAFEVGAGAEQQEPGIIRPKTGTTYDQLDAYLEENFEVEELPKGAAAKIPADYIVSLFDVEDVETVYVTVDFTPGTWYIGSEDSDSEEDPPAPLKVTVA